MFNVELAREKMRSTFDVMRHSEEIDRSGRAFLPASPIYDLESIFEVLLAQIEKEQRKTEILMQAITKVDNIIPRIRQSVEEQYAVLSIAKLTKEESK